MAAKQHSLLDLCSVIVDNRGKTCPVGDAGRPLIATNCVKNTALYPSYQTERFVSDETYASWFRDHPEPGDLIFVTKGSPGQVCITPDPVDFCIAQDMVALRANESLVYPPFLFALLRSDETQDQIGNMHVGTLIPHFKKGDFDKLFLSIPEESEQLFIGDFYLQISERIQRLNRTNDLLEAMARAIFKSWFVDFDPVRAKAEGREPEGMDAATAALFPGEFRDSEIGEIPSGWKTHPVGDLATVMGGSTPSTKEPECWDGGEYAWATPKDLSSLSMPILLSTAKKITSQGLTRISSGLLDPGTVLLSSRAPIGYLAIAEIPTAINQGFIAMKPKDGVSNLFLLFWTKASHEAIVSRANGSTFLEISKSAFRPMPVIVPSPEIMTSFDTIVRPLYEAMVNNEKQSRTLADLRDTLLPRLISGKLRVPEAEAMLTRV
jgi:type I restriction enzyme S subunit